MQAEFAAEQEFLKTLSYLSPEEQQKFKDRQSVQFLYMKPPGADALPAVAAKVSIKLRYTFNTSQSPHNLLHVEYDE